MAAKETNKDLQVLVGATVMVKPVKLHWKSFTAVPSAHGRRGEGYEGLTLNILWSKEISKKLKT